MISGTSTATDVSSSRSRSSTSSTSRSSPASRRSSARAAWNRPVRSSSPTPSSSVRSAGSRWASAPSGISCVAGCPTARVDRAAATLGEPQRLLGEARLADAGRSVEHDARPRRIAIVPTQLLELSRATGQRPRGDHGTITRTSVRMPGIWPAGSDSRLPGHLVTAVVVGGLDLERGVREMELLGEQRAGTVQHDLRLGRRR